MCLKQSVSNHPACNTAVLNRQAGIGLPAAIFLIVVMMLIVGSINQLNELNAQAYGREWLSQRAFYAAESGAQAAAVFVLNTNQVMPACNNAFIANQALNTPGFGNCIINVECSSQVVSLQTYTTLTSIGQCGTGPDQATRIVQVRLTDD
jgi:MSHA biogenesis protein MshP